MMRAEPNDKAIVVNILTNSFWDNQSVNYILQKDARKKERIQALMGYAFDVCADSGAVWLSDDKTACALVTFPDQKKTTLNTIGWDLALIFKATGLMNIKKILSREAQIKAKHPTGRLCYLWFIGVEEHQQGKGIGSELLKGVIGEAEKQDRFICLETSTLRNLPWYKKHGFDVYDELDLGYHLYFLKRG